MNPANETEVIQALAKSDPDTLAETMRRQLAVTRRMVQPDPAVPMGRIDKAAWRQTERIMVAQKLVPGPVGVAERLIEP